MCLAVHRGGAQDESLDAAGRRVDVAADDIRGRGRALVAVSGGFRPYGGVGRGDAQLAGAGRVLAGIGIALEISASRHGGERAITEHGEYKQGLLVALHGRFLCRGGTPRRPIRDGRAHGAESVDSGPCSVIGSTNLPGSGSEVVSICDCVRGRASCACQRNNLALTLAGQRERKRRLRSIADFVLDGIQYRSYRCLRRQAAGHRNVESIRNFGRATEIAWPPCEIAAGSVCSGLRGFR